MFLCAAALSSCKQSEPVLIGFIGGMSTRTADLGVGGRNGAQLAVKLRNQAGGVNGRPIKLMVVDDGQDPEVAREAMSRLINHKVDAVIGPMTSEMGLTVAPLANEAGILMLSPSVSTHLLKGQDDYFFRVIGTANEYGKFNARYQFQKMGGRQVVLFYDLRNKGYSESWLRGYVSEFEKLGGRVIKAISYFSGNNLHFGALIKDLPELRPDGVVIVGNAVDAAMITQRIHLQSPRIQIMLSEWAGTQRFPEMAGKAAEGVVAAQYADRSGTAPAYLAFRKAYRERYSDINHNYASLAFEATNILLDVIERQAPGQTLKQTLLARKEYDGLQFKIIFDKYGDVQRAPCMARVVKGKFVMDRR